MLFELFELSPVKVESWDSVDCDGGKDSEQLSESVVAVPSTLGRWPFWCFFLRDVGDDAGAAVAAVTVVSVVVVDSVEVVVVCCCVRDELGRGIAEIEPDDGSKVVQS